MKLVDQHDVFTLGDAESSPHWQRAWSDVEAAIKCTDWPHGSGTFSIYPESGKKSGMGNGVKPIKTPCVKMLENRGWKTEAFPTFPNLPLTPGDLDAYLPTPDGGVAFEWETGNISSSHRALNKLLLTLAHGGLMGGVLIVPSGDLAAFLTDRIGNIAELRPYFPLWKQLSGNEAMTGRAAILRVAVVEHDVKSFDVPRIPKGTDGRAKR